MTKSALLGAFAASCCSAHATVTLFVPAVQDVQFIGGAASNRGEQILGSAGSGLRNGTVRFDTTALAAFTDTLSTPLLSATVTLREQSGRNANNGSTSTTVGAFFITSTENEGWRLGSNHDADTAGGIWHGNSSARPGNFGGGSTGDNNVDGRNIASGGPIGSGFATGISNVNHTFDPGNSNETVTIDLTQAGATLSNLHAILNEWVIAGNDNSAGLGLYSPHNDQLFFTSLGSNATNVADEAGGGAGVFNSADPTASTSAYLTLTFVPEPSTALLGGLGLLGLLRRRR